MKNFNSFMAVAVLTLSLAGCGLIYTNTVMPLDLNIEQGTPCDFDSKDAKIKHFSLDVARVMWDSNAIGDIVRREGIDTVYFADIETFSILTIWNTYTVHVYGR
ncbi:MAG: LptM family lipoprotein [Planctomycetota bacterium]|jgi:hypothetical protein